MMLFTILIELVRKLWLRWQRVKMRRQYLRYRRRARANGHTALDFGLWRRSVRGDIGSQPRRKSG